MSDFYVQHDADLAAGRESGPRVVSLDEFVAVEEDGADALVGEPGAVLLPENGDAMMYGDGGVGKTTLVIDLAFHLASGDDWLGVVIREPRRVLLVENEGPRALFREKLRRKRDAWEGAPLHGRVSVWEEPWATVDLSDPQVRANLAAAVASAEVDVVIIGPLAASGMTEAGTLQEVREYLRLVGHVRQRAGRHVTFMLVHHESKGGKVSGAWEAAGDTLLHVQGKGHGQTHLYIQKARWSSTHHATTLDLVWTDGEGFAIKDTPETTDEDVAAKIEYAIASEPGTGWTRVAEAVPGVRDTRRREIRDQLLAEGRIVNTGPRGEEWLAQCPPGKRARLHVAHDPAISQLRPDLDAVGTQSASPTPMANDAQLRPCVPPYRRDAGRDAVSVPPAAQLDLDASDDGAP